MAAAYDREVVDMFCAEIIEELERAADTYPGGFHSTHEGYGVLAEEVEELWEGIRHNVSPDELRHEAVQVAAMALRFLLELC